MFNLFKKKNNNANKYLKANIILEKLATEETEPFYNISFSDKSTEDDIYRSKLGGYPYWDKSKQYPKDSNGNMLCMVFQVNFNELNDDRFPKEGILQLFIPNDDGYYGIDLNNYNVQKNWKFIFHEKVDYSLTLEDAIGMNLPSNADFDKDYFPVSKLHFINFEEKCKVFMPKYSTIDEMLNDMIKKCFGDDVNGGVRDYFSEEEYDYLADKLSYSEVNYRLGSKLLGYTDFLECDANLMQYDFRAKDSRYEKYNRLLFQFGSSDFMNWGGDNGNMYIFINSDKLSKKDFSDVCFLVEN